MTLTDTQVADVIDRAITGINPVLDALAERDPIGLKKRTFEPGARARSTLQRALKLAAGVANVADWPGTKGWSELPHHRRANWWVSRIGAVNNLAVAYPGIFGAWTKRLPLTSVLGFANQSMVLVAVAREYGVTERHNQVRLLAWVLCAREVTADEIAAADAPALPTAPEQRNTSLIKAVWEAGKTLRDLNAEVDKRPGPALFFRLLGYIPLVGAPALYLGERIALSKAARAARDWIAAHPDAVTTPH